MSKARTPSSSHPPGNGPKDESRKLASKRSRNLTVKDYVDKMREASKPSTSRSSSPSNSLPPKKVSAAKGTRIPFKSTKASSSTIPKTKGDILTKLNTRANTGLPPSSSRRATSTEVPISTVESACDTEEIVVQDLVTPLPDNPTSDISEPSSLTPRRLFESPNPYESNHDPLLRYLQDRRKSTAAPALGSEHGLRHDDIDQILQKSEQILADTNRIYSSPRVNLITGRNPISPTKDRIPSTDLPSLDNPDLILASLRRRYGMDEAHSPIRHRIRARSSWCSPQPPISPLRPVSTSSMTVTGVLTSPSPSIPSRSLLATTLYSPSFYHGSNQTTSGIPSETTEFRTNGIARDTTPDVPAQQTNGTCTHEEDKPSANPFPVIVEKEYSTDSFFNFPEGRNSEFPEEVIQQPHSVDKQSFETKVVPKQVTPQPNVRSLSTYSNPRNDEDGFHLRVVQEAADAMEKASTKVDEVFRSVSSMMTRFTETPSTQYDVILQQHQAAEVGADIGDLVQLFPNEIPINYNPVEPPQQSSEANQTTSQPNTHPVDDNSESSSLPSISPISVPEGGFSEEEEKNKELYRQDIPLLAVDDVAESAVESPELQSIYYEQVSCSSTPIPRDFQNTCLLENPVECSSPELSLQLNYQVLEEEQNEVEPSLGFRSGMKTHVLQNEEETHDNWTQSVDFEKHFGDSSSDVRVEWPTIADETDDGAEMRVMFDSEPFDPYKMELTQKPLQPVVPIESSQTGVIEQRSEETQEKKACASLEAASCENVDDSLPEIADLPLISPSTEETRLQSEPAHLISLSTQTEPLSPSISTSEASIQAGVEMVSTAVQHERKLSFFDTHAVTIIDPGAVATTGSQTEPKEYEDASTNARGYSSNFLFPGLDMSPQDLVLPHKFDDDLTRILRKRLSRYRDALDKVDEEIASLLWKINV